MLDSIYTKILFFKRRYKYLSSLNFGNNPNQYFLPSYPKSGNTWMRFLLANLLKKNDEEISLQNVWYYIPDLHDAKQKEYILDRKSLFNQLPFQFLKTHDPYFFFYHNKKVIYIVRDGRDVLNSYYFYNKARQETTINVLDLIKSNKGVSNATWSDHVIKWTRGKCKKKIIIKYESLLEDTNTEILKLLNFLGWNLDDEKINEAIRKSSFQYLKRIEEKYGMLNKSKIKNKNSSPFFRKGKRGDWKNTFSESDLQAFWKYQGKAMRKFGYK